MEDHGSGPWPLERSILFLYKQSIVHFHVCWREGIAWIPFFTINLLDADTFFEP